MKKTRRKEITAFRRTTGVSRDSGEKNISEEFSQNRAAGLSSTDDGAASIEPLDVFEAVLSSVDDPCSSQFPQSNEDLVVSVGDAGRAAQQVGRSRKGFYSKLRALRLSVKNSKANPKRISDKRA